MNTKLLCLAIAQALLAASESFAASAENMPDIDGELITAEHTGNAEAAPQITHTAVANAELDKGGLPWDERIHAGTKTKTQKGIWTTRKGLADGVLEAVTAELRQKYPAAATATPVVTTPPATGVVGIPQLNVPQLAVTEYSKLVDWLAKNTGIGKILSDEWIKSAFAQNSTTLAALADDQESSAKFLQAFRDALASTGTAEVA